jgi:hypothetical protein
MSSSHLQCSDAERIYQFVESAEFRSFGPEYDKAVRTQCCALIAQRAHMIFRPLQSLQAMLDRRRRGVFTKCRHPKEHRSHRRRKLPHELAVQVEVRAFVSTAKKSL